MVKTRKVKIFTGKNNLEIELDYNTWMHNLADDVQILDQVVKIVGDVVSMVVFYESEASTNLYNHSPEQLENIALFEKLHELARADFLTVLMRQSNCNSQVVASVLAINVRVINQWLEASTLSPEVIESFKREEDVSVKYLESRYGKDGLRDFVRFMQKCGFDDDEIVDITWFDDDVFEEYLKGLEV